MKVVNFLARCPSETGGLSRGCIQSAVSPVVPRMTKRRRGMTLVEVMISGGVLAITFVGVFGGLFYAYNTAAAIRYRDNARFVLKSIGDQFLVMPAQTTVTSGGSTVISFSPMWTNTGTTATGVGLSWQDFNGTTMTTMTGTTTGLAVTLAGTSGTPVTANVTRKVNYLDSAGAIVPSISRSSAGYLLLGEFTIVYTFKGQPQSQTLAVMRAWQ